MAAATTDQLHQLLNDLAGICARFGQELPDGEEGYTVDWHHPALHDTELFHTSYLPDLTTATALAQLLLAGLDLIADRATATDPDAWHGARSDDPRPTSFATVRSATHTPDGAPTFELTCQVDDPLPAVASWPEDTLGPLGDLLAWLADLPTHLSAAPPPPGRTTTTAAVEPNSATVALAGVV